MGCFRGGQQQHTAQAAAWQQPAEWLAPTRSAPGTFQRLPCTFHAPHEPVSCVLSLALALHTPQAHPHLGRGFLILAQQLLLKTRLLCLCRCGRPGAVFICCSRSKCMVISAGPGSLLLHLCGFGKHCYPDLLLGTYTEP